MRSSDRFEVRFLIGAEGCLLVAGIKISVGFVP